jgi:DNA-binding response OmpR family regulator
MLRDLDSQRTDRDLVRNARTTVLVVDDEEPVVQLVAGYTNREGWDTRAVSDGHAAIDTIRTWDPDVVVLDLTLPGIDGLEVCSELRRFSDAYVLVLSARRQEGDRIAGLAAGADDYVTKPFSPRELVARIKAVQRRPRHRAADAGARLVEGLEVDPARRTVKVDGRAVELTATEFRVLEALTRAPGIVATRAAIYEAAWGRPFRGDNHIVDVYVANIRRKLAEDPARPRFIDTVRSIGYRVREACPPGADGCGSH